MTKAQRTRELSAPALLPACVRKPPPVHNLQIWRPPEALVHLQNWPLKVGLFQMLKSSTASTTSWSTIRKGHYMHKQVHWSRIIMRSNNKNYFQVSTWHLHQPGSHHSNLYTRNQWLSCQHGKTMIGLMSDNSQCTASQSFELSQISFWQSFPMPELNNNGTLCGEKRHSM